MTLNDNNDLDCPEMIRNEHASQIFNICVYFMKIKIALDTCY